MIEVVTKISMWELIKHAGIWLRNLKNANETRKKESVKALRKVVIAARKTAVYMRKLNDTGARSHQTEGEISVLWTELSFALEDLGIKKLANRCQIKGKHWSDPTKTDKDFLEKADVSLEQMEQLANEVLGQIRN